MCYHTYFPTHLFCFILICFATSDVLAHVKKPASQINSSYDDLHAKERSLLTRISDPLLPNEVLAPSISGDLRTWHKISLTFSGPNTSETASPNPFSDYNFQVTFLHADGKTFNIPGFYAACGNAADSHCDSGDNWRVHFAPDRPGLWSWTASMQQGLDAAIEGGGSNVSPIHGMTGTLNILPSSRTGRDLRAPENGRLKYVGAHYLRFSATAPDDPNGHWFFKVGPDAPENTLAYDDFDDTPNRNNRRKSWSPHQAHYLASEASSYTWDGGKGSELLGSIRYLSDQGINAFSFLTFSLAGDDENVFPQRMKVTESEYNSMGDNEQWNSGVHHDRFDVSKLDQWEQVFSYADLKGMYLHFKLQETENDQKMDGGNVGRERKLYYRELVSRFAHHLALNWNTGEENSQTAAQEIAMADYLSSIDPYQNLIVMHTYPSQKNRYSNLTGNQSEYTGASLQSGLGGVHSDVVTWVENSASAGKKWVVANDEQGPAGFGVGVDDAYPDSDLPSTDQHGDNRKDVRHKVLWGTLLGGGAGVEYYYGYQSGCSDLNCQDHQTRETKWADGKIAIDFFNAYLQNEITEMVEFDQLTDDNSDFVLGKSETFYVVYRPQGGNTNLNLPEGTYTVQWYNPRTGDEPSSSVSITNQLSAPDNNDWVAMIRNIEPTNCSDQNVVITQLNYLPGNYHSSTWIKSNAILLDGISLQARAPEFILLEPLFEVKGGATFQALPEACPN